MEWQPIETAPKAGKYILYQPPVLGRLGELRLEARIVIAAVGEHNRPATHWQPLPKPPQAQE